MNIKWNQIALGAAAGFLLGALFSHLYMIYRFPGPQYFGGGGPMEMFSRELGLTEPQKEKVSVIVEKYDPEMEQAMRVNPGLEAVRKRFQAEILPVLTPEQVKKMEILEEKIITFHGRSSGRFHKPGPP